MSLHESEIGNPILRELISEIQHEPGEPVRGQVWLNWGNWINWNNWINWGNWANWMNWWT